MRLRGLLAVEQLAPAVEVTERKASDRHAYLASTPGPRPVDCGGETDSDGDNCSADHVFLCLFLSCVKFRRQMEKLQCACQTKCVDASAPVNGRMESVIRKFGDTFLCVDGFRSRNTRGSGCGRVRNLGGGLRVKSEGLRRVVGRA